MEIMGRVGLGEKLHHMRFVKFYALSQVFIITLLSLICLIFGCLVYYRAILLESKSN